MVTSRRTTILVVDDTEANRYVLCHLLRKAGYEVVEADSIRDAESKLACKPDLVVCDVNLPDGKGTSFTRTVKGSPGNSGAMVLNMSASYTRTRDRIEGLDSGADGYLLQPIDPNEFLATVASLLRIRHAEERIRRKNEDLELISHAIAHDLQEPLRMITCYIDLLERPGGAKLNDDQNRYFSQVRAAAVRMRAIVRDLISLTSADHGGIVRQPIPLRRAFDDALSNLSIMVQQHQPLLTIAPAPSVHGDVGLITQVVQNILSNAMKYRSERPLTIDIAVSLKGHYCEISITDNGIGFPEDSQERVFKAFSRLHAQNEIPGTGIGLAICKRIIQFHDGEIGCRSQLGAGSTFWFTLPLADARHEDAEMQPSGQAP
jgi:two-component system sensor histidine kinase/response regulator